MQHFNYAVLTRDMEEISKNSKPNLSYRLIKKGKTKMVSIMEINSVILMCE